MRHPLLDFLEATGDSVGAFARRVGIAEDLLRALLDSDRAPGGGLARRMSEATGGAVPFEAFFQGGTVSDLSSPDRGDDALDRRRVHLQISQALGDLAPHLATADILDQASEAVCATHAAIARVTTKRGASRLAQALSPVLSEILGDFGVRSAPSRIEEAAERAAQGYWRAPPG